MHTAHPERSTLGAPPTHSVRVREVAAAPKGAGELKAAAAPKGAGGLKAAAAPKAAGGLKAAAAPKTAGGLKAAAAPKTAWGPKAAAPPMACGVGGGRGRMSTRVEISVRFDPPPADLHMASFGVGVAAGMGVRMGGGMGVGMGVGMGGGMGAAPLSSAVPSPQHRGGGRGRGLEHAHPHPAQSARPPPLSWAARLPPPPTRPPHRPFAGARLAGKRSGALSTGSPPAQRPPPRSSCAGARSPRAPAPRCQRGLTYSTHTHRLHSRGAMQ